MYTHFPILLTWRPLSKTAVDLVVKRDYKEKPKALEIFDHFLVIFSFSSL